MFRDKTLWIIGANSDIAKSFITKYSNCFGKVVLTTRETEQISKMLCELGINNADVYHLDLTDKESSDTFIKKAPEPYGVIFFAGHIEYSGKSENNSALNIEDTVSVNFLTPVIMIERVSEKMRKKEDGFIALLSSAGEIRGKYSNRFYVSSKKAVTTYLEGLAQYNGKYNVKTMVFKLGHTDTKMLKKLNNSRKPVFVASPQQVADFLFREIEKNKSTVKYYRSIWKYIARIYACLPKVIYKKIEM